MASKGDNIWVIYPEYLDSAYSRRQGRKVPRKNSLAKPKREELVAAAKEVNLFLYAEDSSYPGFWWKKRGRIIVRKEIPKIKTLKVISKLILEMRQNK